MIGELPTPQQAIDEIETIVKQISLTYDGHMHYQLAISVIRAALNQEIPDVHAENNGLTSIQP